MSLSNRHKKHIAAWGIMLTAGVALSVLTVQVATHGSALPAGATFALLFLLAGAVFLTAVPWWRALDEMQKNAQLTAWYWGGSLGLMFGVMCTVVIGGPGSELVKGAMIVLCTSAATFVVFLLGWGVLHRRGAP